MAADRPKSKPTVPAALLPVLLFFLVLGTFLPCLQNGFVSFDDPFYVTQNAHVTQGLTWENLKWAWSSTEAQNWHPLTWISHMLDVQLFGLNPWGHHTTNVVSACAQHDDPVPAAPKNDWRALAQFCGGSAVRIASASRGIGGLGFRNEKDVLSTCFWLLTTWAGFAHPPRQKVQKPKARARKPIANDVPQPQVRSLRSGPPRHRCWPREASGIGLRCCCSPAACCASPCWSRCRLRCCCSNIGHYNGGRGRRPNGFCWRKSPFWFWPQPARR